MSRFSVVTLTEVAKQAGISRATAARALGGYGSVSPAARERVLAAAAALHYRPNLLARNTRTGTTTTVGVVVADIGNPFFAQAVRSISDAARAIDLDVMVLNTDEQVEAEQAAVRLLLAQRVLGMIVAPTSPDESRHLREVKAEGVALVLLDRRVRGLDVDQVYADNFTGTMKAMAQLTGAGHRRIAFITSTVDPRHPIGTTPVVDDIPTSVRDRVRAYASTLKALGEDPFRYFVGCDFGEQGAYDATRRLLRQAERPTALFASDSVIALGVLRAIAHARLAIPADVAVAAGDEPAWSLVTTPAMAAVTQPVVQLGRCALETLASRLKEPDRASVNIMLPTVYHARASGEAALPRRQDGDQPCPVVSG